MTATPTTLPRRLASADDWIAQRPHECTCCSRDEMVLAIERAGAAKGAYIQAWRARGHLRAFFTAVVILALVVGALWLITARSARQGDNLRSAVADANDYAHRNDARVTELETKLATAPTPVVPAASVPAAEASAPPDRTADRELSPTEPPTVATPAAAHSETTTTPDTTLPPLGPPQTVPQAHLVDGCVLGVCVKLG